MLHRFLQPNAVGHPERHSGTCAQLALDTFEAEWGELVGMKSSASVAQDDETMQQGREAALNGTAESEVLVEVSEAKAKRVSLKGTEFTLKGAKLWNIMNPTGASYALPLCFQRRLCDSDITQAAQWTAVRSACHQSSDSSAAAACAGAMLPDVSHPQAAFAGKCVGQAVRVDQIVRADGSVYTFASSEAGGSPEEVEAQEKVVAERGAAVRALKEGEGLTNENENVKAAVQELLDEKDKLAHMKGEA
jgi:MEKHLA domain